MDELLSALLTAERQQLLRLTEGPTCALPYSQQLALLEQTIRSFARARAKAVQAAKMAAASAAAPSAAERSVPEMERGATALAPAGAAEMEAEAPVSPPRRKRVRSIAHF